MGIILHFAKRLLSASYNGVNIFWLTYCEPKLTYCEPKQPHFTNILRTKTNN